MSPNTSVGSRPGTPRFVNLTKYGEDAGYLADIAGNIRSSALAAVDQDPSFNEYLTAGFNNALIDSGVA
jgi:hypothetical protein